MGTTSSRPEAKSSPPSAQLWPSTDPQDWGTTEMEQPEPRDSKGMPGNNRTWAFVAIAAVVVAGVGYVGYLRTQPRYPLGITPVAYQNGFGQNGLGQNGLGQNGLGQNGLGQNGVRNGVTPNGAVPNGAVANGFGQNGQVQNGIGQNGIGQPGAGQLGAGQLGVGQLGAGQLGVGQPGVGQPGIGQPGIGQPGVGQPGIGQPGVGQPGIDLRPGGAVPLGQPNGQIPGGAPALPQAVQGGIPLGGAQNFGVQTGLQTPVAQGAQPLAAGVQGAARNVDWQAVTTQVQRSVVQVTVPGGQTATGVAIGRTGEIATVAHIFPGGAGGQAGNVTMPDGRVVQAQLLGLDRLSDVALLRVADAAPTPVMIGDANTVRLGDPVLAVGNQPNGGSTVSSGVVSGMHRLIGGVDPGLGSNRRVDLIDAIATDATMAAAAGGGALIDRTGRLVGIVVVSTSGGQATTGQVFAIPVNVVTTAARQLAATGQVMRTWLGVTVRDAQVQVSPAVTVQAVVVTEVQPGTPAARANFTPGDAVTAIDGVPVTSAGAFASRIFGIAADGPGVTLTVVRNMQTFQVRVPLANRPASQTMADAL